MLKNRQFTLKQIGVIKTPYQNDAPYQPVETDDREFYVLLDDQYADGLMELEKFKYIYLIFFADRIGREPEMMISPPGPRGKRSEFFQAALLCARIRSG
jgi:tRNA (Thr-GGU) A37 N-methylase